MDLVELRALHRAPSHGLLYAADLLFRVFGELLCKTFGLVRVVSERAVFEAGDFFLVCT